MDKIELTREDIEALLEWRDEHKALVRSLPAPLKAVEIRFKHNSYRIKGIRKGDQLTLYVSNDGENLGRAEMQIGENGQLIRRKTALKIDEEDFQSTLTVYCSLMALMNSRKRGSTSRAINRPLRSENKRLHTYFSGATESSMQLQKAHTPAQRVSSRCVGIIDTIQAAKWSGFLNIRREPGKRSQKHTKWEAKRMSTNQNTILKAVLHCGTMDLSILDDIEYDLGEIVEELIDEGIQPTLNQIMSEVFRKATEDMTEAVNEEIMYTREDLDDLDEDEEEQETFHILQEKLSELLKLNPEEDIDWYCNCLDTSIYIKRNSEIYNRYMTDAVEKIGNLAGFPICPF